MATNDTNKNGGNLGFEAEMFKPLGVSLRLSRRRSEKACPFSD